MHATGRLISPSLIALALVAAMLLAVAPPSVQAQQSDDHEQTAGQLITRETDRAIDRGLAYLAARQHDDGSFGSGGYSRNVAVCALSGMAFMSAGSTPGRGPYGREVAACVNFIAENTGDNGFISVAESSSHGPMYGHGFATLFLAEAYGMSQRRDIREKLALAVELIVSTQNKDGGWRYQPQKKDADLSVSVCQIMALRAARNAGISVPRETIERCIAYVKKSQNADGGFMYMVQGGQSAFPRSAAGVVALYSTGIYEGKEVTTGIDYLMEFIPRRDAFHRESHYYYGHYYAVQAMWHAGGDKWKKWYPAIRGAMMARQREDGSWMDSICPEYGTAMGCIVLQMPNNYLPIFQR
ncbi:MAG: terpene cyclase/mutase family protein [Planctomycetes bacterium]|nr:terpene cyclase/mutase family protein [Planctomycetota bacterium]